MDFGGHTVDRFYHVITPADSRMIGWPRRSGLGDQLRFSPVGVGFYAGRWAARLQRHRATSCASRRSARSGARGWAGSWPSASCAAATRRWRTSPWSGGCAATAATRCWDKIWRPLLDSRFEGNHSELPGHLPVGAHPAHVGGAHRPRAPRGDGPRGGRPPAADRRRGRARPGSGRGRAHRRRGAGPGGRGRPGDGRAGGLRDRALRADHRHAPAAGPGAPAAGRDERPARGLPQAVAGRGLRGPEGAASRCCRTTR